MERIQFDIVSENFDQYIQKTCLEMGPEQRAEVPVNLFTRLFANRGRTITQRTLDRTGFLGKIFVLAKAMKKRIFILVEGNDAETAMNIHDFVNFRQAEKDRSYGEGPARELISHGHFVIGTKELMDGVAYLNAVSAGPAYTYLTKLKNGKQDSLSEWQRQREYIVKFILNFEANKKKWQREFHLNMSAFLVLIYIYPGKEVTGSEIYNIALVNAQNSSGAEIRTALSFLRNRKLLTKQGVSKGATFRVTPLGRHMVDEIMDKYGYRF